MAKRYWGLMFGIAGKDNLENKELCLRVESRGKEIWSVDNWGKK